MKLERIHLYYLVRGLRVVIPLIVLVLAGLFFWNYSSERPRPAEDPGTRLGEDMSGLTEGLTYTQGEGGRARFTVSAGRNLGFASGVNRLEGDVEVTVPGFDDVPDRRIRGAQCGVRQEQGVVECEGGIEIELDERTVARTERVAYDDVSGVLTTSGPVEVLRSGEFEVSAADMRAMFRERILRFEGDVRILRADGMRLESGALSYDETTSLVVASGGVRISSALGDVTGQRVELTLMSGSEEPSRIVIRGSVRGRSSSPDDPGRIEAESVEMDVGGGEIRGVHARGQVVVEFGAGSSARSVSGNEVVAVFGRDGALESLAASGEAAMTLGSGTGRIRSSTIRQTGTRTIETGMDSALRMEEVSVQGGRFVIEDGETVSVRTDDPSTIVVPAGTMEGNATRALVDRRTGALVFLEQTGAVRFTVDGLTGTAEAVRVDPSVVHFDGRVLVRDPEYTLESQAVMLNQSDDSLEASGGVFLLARVDGDSLVVTSDRLRGRPREVMRFDDAVTLRQGDTEVRADAITVEPDGRSFSAERNVVSVVDGLRVTADTLRLDDTAGRITYEGNVHGQSEEVAIDSDALWVTMIDREIDRVDADGDVRVTSSEGAEGGGRGAVYLRSEGTVTLNGPGAYAIDPSVGRCSGDIIVIDVRTHDVAVRGQTECVPYTVPEGRIP